MGIITNIGPIGIIRSLSDSGSTGSSKLDPNKLYYVITGGQDYQSTINNDGSLWFWPGGGPGTFQCVITNIEDGTIEKVTLQFSSRADNTADILGWSINDGSVWNIDNTTYSIVDGGTLTSPKFTLSNEMTITNPIAEDGTFRFHLVEGDGILTPAKTFSESFIPGEVAGANFNAGTYLNSIPSTFIGIGPFPDRMFLKLTNTYPRVNIDLFGDSTIAEVQPLAAPENTRKDGIWHKFNDNAITNSLPIRIYSRGQGGATWTDTVARVQANLPYMSNYTDIIGVQIWSWNESPTSIGEAAAQWSAWLSLKSEIEAAGFKAFPLILHPYTTRTSSGQIDAFNFLKDLVSTNNGIDLSNITGSTSYPNLVGSESEDNIHMNISGAVRCGPAIVSTITNWVGQYYNI